MTDVCSRLLIGVSGSIAAVQVPGYVNAFRAAGVARVAAIMTTAAEQFVRAGALAHFCDQVFTDTDQGPGHINLARWADRLLILPASANTLGQAAHGLATNLLTTTLLATAEPVIFAPAMNVRMWKNARVQRNISLLREDGHQVVNPEATEVYEAASRAMRPGLALPPAANLLVHLRPDSPEETTDARSGDASVALDPL